MTTTTRKPRTGKKSEARRSAMAQRWAQMMDLASTMELAMTEDADVMAAVENMAERTGYSLRNASLIVGQCEHATAVKSFKKWQGEGRQVRKGEKALYIFAPTKKRQDKEKEGGEQAEKAKPEQTERPAEDAKKREDGETPNRHSFVLVPVFDVSQTDPTEADDDTEA